MALHNKNGFSLMEMMVVLLIISIIAAATAPMITKKMARDSVTGNSPWVFTGEGANIAFNMEGRPDATVLIGTLKCPSNTKAKLYIDCGKDTAQIALGKGNTAASILADPEGKRIGIFSASSNVNIPNDSVSLGMNQSLAGSNIIAIGSNVVSNNSNTTAIGHSAEASDSYATAIGSNSSAKGQYSTAIGYNAKAPSIYSTAIGYGSTSNNGGIAIGYSTDASNYATAIGYNSKATNGNSVAYGYNSSAKGVGTAIGNNSQASDSTALGYNAKANGDRSTAIGFSASSQAQYSTAIGCASLANKTHASAFGYNAQALHNYSTAVGRNAYTTATNQIAIGTSQDTVYIPGNLRVEGTVELATRSSARVRLRTAEGHSADGANNTFGTVVYGQGRSLLVTGQGIITPQLPSDKRLKNVKNEFTEGLNNIKKLKIYNFTYKNDENKTPHVGVLAQDLQKIFPNAVSKNQDGYLQIRLEDMFYASINAIIELDTKIEHQNKIIKTQEQKISELEERISKLEKLLK